MGEALGILLDEQAIEEPHGMAVESGYALIHLQGIAAMGLPLLIHQLPELLERGIALVALENSVEIVALRFSKVLADERGNESVELNHAGLPMRR
jgi:hypothetical protein